MIDARTAIEAAIELMEGRIEYLGRYHGYMVERSLDGVQYNADAGQAEIDLLGLKLKALKTHLETIPCSTPQTN